MFQVNSVRLDQFFLKGSSDVDGDLVGEVFEYLVNGKYCDGM